MTQAERLMNEAFLATLVLNPLHTLVPVYQIQPDITHRVIPVVMAVRCLGYVGICSPVAIPKYLRAL